MKRNSFIKILSLAVALVAVFCSVVAVQARPVTVPGGVPDYFETPNWANSPPLTKFVDGLPGLGAANKNNLNQYIPVGVADTTTYPGSDYYEIALVQYREQMHSDLPVVVGAYPNQTSGGTLLRGYVQELNGVPLDNPHYLGPLIIAQKDRPVRIKFTNRLPTGAGGNLFVPVDTTIMGSGPYEINYDPATGVTAPPTIGTFTQNRATLHLHGGRTPWISDGTPHQWITPAGEATTYPRGVSVKNVPDMPDPGDGSQTFYWTNQQSSRLMFYHDHAWGITRLNVYVGEAAGYMIQDPVELALIQGGIVNGRTYGIGTIPVDQIPLIIQDKTFVNADPISGVSVLATDPTWNWGSTPGTPVTGDLWWPHVYMPAQNPFNPDLSGINAMGRWHYGPWFFPATPQCGSIPQAVPPWCINFGPVDNPYFGAANPGQPPFKPGTPDVSWGAEAFLDTMMVNGTVYPKLDLPVAKPYRFRILNASHDRFLNLQLYKATSIVSGVTVESGGSGYVRAPAVTITNAGGDLTGKGATATAAITGGVVTAITLNTVGSGYTLAPTVTVAAPTGLGGAPATATAGIWTQLTEVGMVPAAPNSAYPLTWPADGREGGVPDPDNAGPAFIQIGSEGGFLPAPVVLENQPVAWNLDPTMFNVGNVLQQRDGGGTVILGPAERADVIVDFTNYAGQTLILYNDGPTAFPALDPHYDYYTGAPDRTDIGGYVTIPPGVGPNNRTVMQINVVPGAPAGTAPANDYNAATLTALQAAFVQDPTSGVSGVFQSSQDPIIVGQTAYNTTYNTTFPATWPNWGLTRVSDGAISFQKVDGTIMSNLVMKPKAIHDEMGGTFDDYGRMAARLGLESPFTNAAIMNFILQNFVDPVTETVNPDEIQIWRITHNGVDTHPIHFHLFDVQVINRVGWDGFIRLPDDNELGWKDTVRMAPLEDTIVALRPVAPRMPFGQPNSIRPLNPAMPFGSTEGFSQTDITDGGALTPLQTNVLKDFNHEYVWHCHILSHEENDMMRPVSFVAPNALPSAPTGLAAAIVGSGVTLAWTDPTPAADPATLGNPANEIGFRVERAAPGGAFAKIATAPANATGYTDATGGGGNFSYRVVAFNAAGEAVSNTATVGAAVDTVAITSVTYSGNNRQLTVNATSSGAPSAVLSATAVVGGNTVNLGTLSYNAGSNTYRRTFSNVNSRPASVTVTSSAGGSATYNFPAADTINITSVTYTANNRRLVVNATSSAGGAGTTLSATAVVGGTTRNLGSLTYNAGSNTYSRTFSNVNSRPSSVTVNSSAGGSATYTFPADTVTITAVTWSPNNRRLAITATSSTGGAGTTLSATAVTTRNGNTVNVNLRTLSYNRQSNTYRRTFTLQNGTTAVSSVTVTSTGGGSAIWP